MDTAASTPSSNTERAPSAPPSSSATVPLSLASTSANNNSPITPTKRPITVIVLVLLLLAIVGATTYFAYQSVKKEPYIPPITIGITEPHSCIYLGKMHRDGESFPSGDGCNTCSCQQDGKVACTEMACVTPEPTTQKYTNNNIPIDLSLLYSFTLPKELAFNHYKAGPSQSDEGFDSSKYPSLKIWLEQTWRNGFSCADLISSETISIKDKPVKKEVWKGLSADHAEVQRNGICDSFNGHSDEHYIFVELKPKTDNTWGHHLVFSYSDKELSELQANQIFDQILSTFEFSNLDQGTTISEGASAFPSETIDRSLKPDR